MKVEDLLPIVKKELTKVGMVEYVDDSGSLESLSREMGRIYGTIKPMPSRFEYQNLRLASYRKVDNKWHITAKFESAHGVISPTIVSMVIDDQTGEVSEMSGG
jgi:hypothetical protein